MTTRTREMAVVRIGDDWRIVTTSRAWGRFALRDEAEEAALRLCRAARGLGLDMSLLVQERHGELRRIRPV